MEHILGDYDLAGFAVGAVERTALLPRPDIAPGDVLLGLPSSGLHSNGFSLVRKILSLDPSLSYTSPCPWPSSPSSSPSDSGTSQTLGEALLTPTRLYIKPLLPVLRSNLLKGLAHITGGGLIDNVPRIFPKSPTSTTSTAKTSIGARIDVTTWPLPPLFRFLQTKGNVEPKELARTFNCGVGMVLVVARGDVDAVREKLKEGGEEVVYEIGEVVWGEGVELVGVESWAL